MLGHYQSPNCIWMTLTPPVHQILLWIFVEIRVCPAHVLYFSLDFLLGTLFGTAPISFIEINNSTWQNVYPLFSNFRITLYFCIDYHVGFSSFDLIVFSFAKRGPLHIFIALLHEFDLYLIFGISRQSLFSYYNIVKVMIIKER